MLTPEQITECVSHCSEMPAEFGLGLIERARKFGDGTTPATPDKLAEVLQQTTCLAEALQAERDQLLNLVRDLAPYAASVLKGPRSQAKADTQEHISRGDRSGVTYGQLREIVRIAARATAEELA